MNISFNNEDILAKRRSSEKGADDGYEQIVEIKPEKEAEREENPVISPIRNPYLPESDESSCNIN